MISRRKQKIYIAIIVFCVAAGAAVLFLNRKPGDKTDQQAPIAATENAAETPPAPQIQVYPKNRTFDETFFGSSFYQSLQPYQPIRISEKDLGVDDPFRKSSPISP